MIKNGVVIEHVLTETDINILLSDLSSKEMLKVGQVAIYNLGGKVVFHVGDKINGVRLYYIDTKKVELLYSVYDKNVGLNVDIDLKCVLSNINTESIDLKELIGVNSFKIIVGYSAYYKVLNRVIVDDKGCYKKSVLDLISDKVIKSK